MGTNVVGSAIMGFAVAGAARNSLPASAAAWGGGIGAVGLLSISVLVSVSFFIFFLYLGRRAWRIEHEYRALAAFAHARAKGDAGRLWISRAAWAGALFYSLALVGNAGANLYRSVSTLATMPGTAAVISSNAGVQLTVNPVEWNQHAWKLATNPDPSTRNPSEAVRLAELAVAADPKNGSFMHTLGVARYRARDFTGAIEALKRSLESRGSNAEDELFLAMASARIGRSDEARAWYQKAGELMRQTKSRNAEARRFREEAAAVLEVLGVHRIEAGRTPGDEPFSGISQPN
jgi:tetratricopeptide (TPR) repeat protein